MAYFDNILCNEGDGKCNDPSICWDFTVSKNFGGGKGRGAQSTPPELHLGALTRACSLGWLSQLGPDGPNFNFLVNALDVQS